MLERDPEKNLPHKIFKTMFDAKRKVEQFIPNTKYKIATTKEQRENALKSSEFINSDFLAFLDDNLSAKLAVLHPTEVQLMYAQFLMATAKEGLLKLEAVEGAVDVRKNPCLSKLYTAKAKFYPAAAGLGTIYYVNSQLRHFSLLGREKDRSIGHMYFASFPQKPPTSNDMLEALGFPLNKPQPTISFINKNDRIIIDLHINRHGKQIDLTMKYNFVGTFEGEASKETFYVYGHNTIVDRSLSLNRSSSATFSLAKTVK